MKPTRACSITGCEARYLCRGLCNRHYRLARANGNLPPMTVMEKLLTHCSIDDSTGCWLWHGYTDKDGYGRSLITITPGERNSRLVHRIAYELAKGPIPDGLTVDHMCFVRNCINPSHLRLLTPLQNARNQRKVLSNSCANGHEYTPANTRRRADGSRACRACEAASQRRYRARKVHARTKTEDAP